VERILLYVIIASLYVGDHFLVEVRKMFRKLALLTLVAALGILTTDALTAAEKSERLNPGYNIQLSSATIDLVFPDGSVLSAPRNFDGESLEGITASEGMARELLDSALEQMGLKTAVNLPKAFSLGQNFPNPFNPSTVISYTIPDESEEVAVRLSVFNMRAQLVKTLVDKVQQTGIYTVNWDGIDNKGRRVSSGVYFYRLSAGQFVSMRKMVLLK